MNAVLPMPAKKNDAAPGKGDDGSGKRPQTTIRVYTDTARKVNELATMLDTSIPDTLEKLFEDRLDNELVEAIEARAKQLKKKG